MKSPNEMNRSSIEEDLELEEEVVCSHIFSNFGLTDHEAADFFKHVRAVDPNCHKQEDLEDVCITPTGLDFKRYDLQNFRVQSRTGQVYSLASKSGDWDTRDKFYSISAQSPQLAPIVLNEEPVRVPVVSWLNKSYWITMFRDLDFDDDKWIMVVDLATFKIIHRVDLFNDDSMQIDEIYSFQDGQLVCETFEVEVIDNCGNYELSYFLSIIDLKTKGLLIKKPISAKLICEFFKGCFYWLEYETWVPDRPNILVQFDPYHRITKETPLDVSIKETDFRLSSVSKLDGTLVDGGNIDSCSGR